MFARIGVLRALNHGTPDPAITWFRENDPDGVAFEYPVIGVG
jgi:hypothetical protein